MKVSAASEQMNIQCPESSSKYHAHAVHTDTRTPEGLLRMQEYMGSAVRPEKSGWEPACQTGR